MVFSGLIALVVSLGTIGAFQLMNGGERAIRIEHIESSPARGVLMSVDENGAITPLNFTETAAKVVDAVVHIKSTQTIEARRQEPRGYRQMPDPFRDFFGERGNPFEEFFRFEQPRGPEARVGTGSGVIINPDGYIVTNNHVIADADDIEVTLADNQSFKARVVGTDPSTDLALLQIKADGLPSLPLVNSDDVQVGEWVLAVGNPLGLNSTVTAGIVSAKGRNINILRERFAVESFIQTDAAINPGNSGGALVNLQGGLLGINTAIASPTGTYAGYGFAVPSNIVSKVVEDLLEFGSVQRGILGVMIRSVDGNLAREKDLSTTTGVFVDSLLENSAAAAAGIQPGDVIIAINDNEVKSSPELQELIARRRPGDVVEVRVLRNGSPKIFNVTLNTRNGRPAIAASKNQADDLPSLLGAEFETIEKDLATRLDIEGGVKIVSLSDGRLRQQTDIREGFIITRIDREPVTNVESLEKALSSKRGGVMLEGVYEDVPGAFYYAFGMPG